MESYENLLNYLKNIEFQNYVVAMLRWEMDTTAPKKSFNYLIEVSTKYEMESFKYTTDEKFI